MASRGSVIPLFVDLIKSNKGLTITDPKMTRFMMIRRCYRFSFICIRKCRAGDIFVQKAPGATIETLSKALLDLYQSNSELKIIEQEW